MGPPIIVQSQFDIDRSASSLVLNNLRDGRVVAVGAFGASLGFCDFRALECETSRMAIGDVTGDGDENLVATEPTSLDHERVVIYDQGGLVLGGFDLPDGDAAMIAAAQLTGDGRAEIVVALEGQLRVYDDTGTFLGGLVLPAFDEIVTADVDGDGLAEFAVRRGSSVEFIELNGTVASTLEVTAFDPLGDEGAGPGSCSDGSDNDMDMLIDADDPECRVATLPTTFTIGDPDGDAVNELLAVIPNADVFESSAVWVLAIPSGVQETRFTVVSEKVLEILSSNLVGGLEHEVLLVTESDVGDGAADLVVTDGAGAILAIRPFIYFPDRSDATRGPSRLIVGHKTYPDRDMDSLLDAWETNGIDLQGMTLDLPALGADPDHKDLFVELDWMSDPSLAETGLGGSVSLGARGGFVGGTCGDGVDNDDDDDTDAADPDCIDPRQTEDTPGACGNGLDDDNDGMTDGADQDCIISGVVDPTLPEGGTRTCGDGLDNDDDGLTDAADGDCYQPALDEAGPGSCGDGLDNNGDGLIDSDDPVCATGGITQSEIRRMLTGFCAAPSDAGVLGVPNPDGLPGIRLHMDLGGLRDGNGIETDVGPCSCGDGIDNDGDGAIDGDDPGCSAFDPSGDEGDGFGSCSDGSDNDMDTLADDDDPGCRVADASLAETPIGAGTCADGLDNDGDGSTDLADPNCLVGDPLTTDGGNPIALDEVCRVGDTFYDLKRANFVGSSFRSRVYRYGIATKCTGSGGQAEIGGNDFAAANDDAGTIMHELGHTLNLRHGGNNNTNCKPNHASVMNYDLQFGIPRRGGSRVYDYSPPRYPGGRGVAPLPDLREDQLDETIVLDAGDRFNQSAFSDGMGQLTPLDLDGDRDANRSPDGIDWDGDGSIASMPVQANINDGSCDSGSSSQRLTGHDDWRRVSLSPFTSCGDPDGIIETIQDFFGACLNEDGAVNPVEGPEPTSDDLLVQIRELNKSDLMLSLTAHSDVVEVGDDLAYALTVRNDGPNPAAAAALDVSLPERGSLREVPHDCVGAIPELECRTDAIAEGRTRSVEVVVGTAEACVDGIPQPLIARAFVENGVEGATPDPTPEDNRARLEVETQDTTAPQIDCAVPLSILPNEAADEDEPTAAPIAFTATARDVCDDAPEVQILGFDCFALTKKGGRVDKTQSCVIEIEGATLTVVNSGGVGNTIEWTVQAQDAVGNVARETCEVAVKRPGT